MANRNVEDLAAPLYIGSGANRVKIDTDGSITLEGDAELLAQEVTVTDTNDNYSGVEVEAILTEIGDTRHINGYDLTDADSLPDLAFDNSTRTFSVSVQAGQSSFHFWADSKKVVKTTTQSVQIDDTTGTYYIIFDTTGTLVAVTQDAVAADDFYEHAITGLVYWNATANTGLAGDERHGILMDARTHHYNHSTFGARYGSGIGISGLTDGGTTYTTTTAGTFWDEDIQHILDAQATSPFIYKLGSGGEWTAVTPDNLLGFKNSGTDVVYNEEVTGTWQLTVGDGDHDFMVYFMIATPDINGYNVKKIVGQNGYKDAKKARAGMDSEIANLITDGLPSPEYIFLFAYIVEQDGSLVEQDDGSLFVDLRAVKGGVGGGVAAAHNELASLQGGASGEYYHLTEAEHTALASISLAATVSVYVTTTGDDSTGDGTSGSPYATVGKAYEEILTRNYTGFTSSSILEINVGAGTFSETESILVIDFLKGSTFRIKGAGDSSTTISFADGKGIIAQGVRGFRLDAFTLKVTGTTGIGLQVQSGASVGIDCTFDTVSTAKNAIWIQSGSSVVASSTIYLKGSWADSTILVQDSSVFVGVTNWDLTTCYQGVLIKSHSWANLANMQATNVNNTGAYFVLISLQSLLWADNTDIFDFNTTAVGCVNNSIAYCAREGQSGVVYSPAGFTGEGSPTYGNNNSYIRI